MQMKRSNSVEEAVKYGDVQNIRRLLHSNKAQSDVMRSLKVALEQHLGEYAGDVVALLLSYADDLNVLQDGKSLLTSVIESSSWNISGREQIKKLQLLLEAGCDVNLRDINDHTALFAACERFLFGHDEAVVRLLIEHGADVDCVCAEDTVLCALLKSPVWKTSGDDQMEKLRELIRLQVNTDIKHFGGKPPLHLACERPYGSLGGQVVYLLASWVKDVDAIFCQQTALTCLLLSDWSNFDEQLQKLQILLDKRADVDKRNSYGETPLYLACRRSLGVHGGSVVKLLTDHGADVNALCWGQTILSTIFINPTWSSCPQEALQKLKHLLKAGADISRKDDSGQTAIEMINSSSLGHIKDSVMVLISKYDKVNKS